MDSVYVTSDQPKILEVSKKSGAITIFRPEKFSSDTASSESALLHACEVIQNSSAKTHPKVLVFVQATSPFINPKELDQAINLVLDGKYDSVFSATVVHDFIWEDGEDGAIGVNHNPSIRKRRQDRTKQFRETGAFYVMNWDKFSKSKHRFFGRIGVVEVDPVSSIEIDTHSDLKIARLVNFLQKDQLIDFKNFKALVTDFDGVHTDDFVYLDENGIESVLVSRSDGLGIERTRSHGLEVLILSKETNKVVQARSKKLQVECIQSSEDKKTALQNWVKNKNISLSEVIYVGNDINDIDAMKIVGLPVAVNDAHIDVKLVSSIVLRNKGGKGAIREICDLIVGI